MPSGAPSAPGTGSGAPNGAPSATGDDSHEPGGDASSSHADAGAHDPLDEARALEATLDYERALVIVDREIARGAATAPARLIALHLLAGRLAAGLDHDDVAQAHFARVLALAPDTQLPDGTSPKLTAPFDAARAATVPLRIAFERAGDVISVRLGLDPAHLFDGLRVHLAPRAGQLDAVRVHGPSVALPQDRVAIQVDAIDEYGNVLADAPLASSAPAPATTARTRVLVPPHSSPIYARWSTWAIATAGALAIAGTCAWRFGVAQDDWNRLEDEGGHDYSELAAVESRGRAWGIAADVGFGVAAAAGITAIVLLAVRHDPSRVPSPAASGDAFALTLHF